MSGKAVAVRVLSVRGNLSTSQLVAGQVYRVRFTEATCEWWSQGLIDHMYDKRFVEITARASPTLSGHFGPGVTEMTTELQDCPSPLDKNVVLLNLHLTFDAQGQLLSGGQVYARLEEDIR